MDEPDRRHPSTNASVDFFDAQFARQLREGELDLNPFERASLPYLSGHVLDFGCGLGNLAVAAASRGCSVLALDASQVAIEHLRRIASQGALAIEARAEDLRRYEPSGEFDAVVSIGLLMFFGCDTARRQLANLQARVRPGGIAAVNVLVEGTTYLEMFDQNEHCLFRREELQDRFAGWEFLHREYQDFKAPDGSVKSFATIIARKPDAMHGRDRLR